MNWKYLAIGIGVVVIGVASVGYLLLRSVDPAEENQSGAFQVIQRDDGSETGDVYYVATSGEKTLIAEAHPERASNADPLQVVTYTDAVSSPDGNFVLLKASCYEMPCPQVYIPETKEVHFVDPGYTVDMKWNENGKLRFEGYCDYPGINCYDDVYESKSAEDPWKMQNIAWQTYRNERYGFEVGYPAEWNEYAPMWNGECVEASQASSKIVFTSQSLEMCGFLGELLPSPDADITVWVRDAEWENIETVFGEPRRERIIGGEKAVLYPNTEERNRPYGNFSRLYFNHDGNGYLVFLKQEGSGYSSVYEEMLSTFDFIEKGTFSDWNIYRNEELGFEIQYPSSGGWEVVEEQGQISLLSKAHREFMSECPERGEPESQCQYGIYVTEREADPGFISGNYEPLLQKGAKVLSRATHVPALEVGFSVPGKEDTFIAFSLYDRYSEDGSRLEYDKEVFERILSTFSFSDPFITITAPTLQAVWKIGSTHTVSWNSISVKNVRISTASGGKNLGDSLLIPAGIGQYQYKVPDLSGFGLTPPYKLKIRIYDNDNSQLYDEVTYTAIQ